MASVLANTKLPLWVWIVIIIVGTLVVLGTLALFARLLIVRRRQADFLHTFGDDDLPQRKMTVRRGRVVEQSKYLSLTGSRFGLNAFNADDNDANSGAGARSKSPFEWWSTVRDRPQSRNSQLTQMSNTNDAASICGLPTTPNHQLVFQRGDLNYSNTSLTSTSKEDNMSVTATEALPASPPAVVRNFSRSFARPTPFSKYSPRQHTLSRIEESSPHTSMISTRQSRIASLVSNKRDTKSSTTSTTPHSPALSSLLSQTPRWSTTNASKTSSIYHDAQDQAITQISRPAPAANTHNRSYSNQDDPNPRSSHVSSQASHEDTMQPLQQQHSNQITALPEQTDSKQPNNYWGTRSDLHPIRTTSKKGNVLRKKSLKRLELAGTIKP